MINAGEAATYLKSEFAAFVINNSPWSVYASPVIHGWANNEINWPKLSNAEVLTHRQPSFNNFNITGAIWSCLHFNEHINATFGRTKAAVLRTDHFESSHKRINIGSYKIIFDLSKIFFCFPFFSVFFFFKEFRTFVFRKNYSPVAFP